jgi:hypothetical protein
VSTIEEQWVRERTMALSKNNTKQSTNESGRRRPNVEITSYHKSHSSPPISLSLSFFLPHETHLARTLLFFEESTTRLTWNDGGGRQLTMIFNISSTTTAGVG